MHALPWNSMTLAVMGALAAGFSGSALAQQADSTATVMAEVTISGQAEANAETGYRTKRSSASGFRAKPLLDTPFSVTAISAEVIADQQAKTLADVAKNDPSLTLSSDPAWFSRIFVRGFVLSVDAVKRDGLSINDQGAIALDNKAAVEVSKGLAGLRYGMTSPGGVVNYVVKRPAAGTISRVTLNGNDDGAVGVSADLSRRFGQQQQFGVRINAAGDELRNHSDRFKGDRSFFSTAFDWQASERLLLELDLERQRSTSSEPGTPAVRWWSTPAEARAAFDRLDANTFSGQDWATAPNRQAYYSARAQYQFNDQWKATLSTLRSKLSRDQGSITPRAVQADGEYRAIYYFSPDQHRDNTSWQLVAEGDLRTGSLSHELAFGADSVRRDMIYGDGFNGDIGAGNLYNPRPIAQPRPAVGPSYLANRSDQAALFVTDTVSLPGGVQVFGGLRRTAIDIWSGNAAGTRTKVYEKMASVPSAGVLYKPAARMSVYASYAEGIEQGGTAPVEAGNRNEVMKPLESRQVEVGTKVELGKDALLTAALFRIDKGLEYLDAANFYVQDGSQLHEGAELTVAGQAAPGLRLIAGAAYLKARVRETANTALIGKRPQGVPEWQANMYADYSLQPVLAGLSVNGGLYYVGKKAVDAANTWLADDYVRVDAGVRYAHTLAGGKLATLRVGIENLTDKRYLTNTNGAALTFGAPRSVRASLALDF